MSWILAQVIWFLLVFVLMFIIYFIMLSKKIKKGKTNAIGEVSYLLHRFGLDQKKVNFQSLKRVVCMINAFIISFVANFIMLIPVAMVWRFLIGFVLLFALIYSFYEIYGRILKKKYGKK